MKKVIAIVGMPGSGKSEAGVFFKEKGIPVLRFGSITDEGLQAKGLSLTQENEKPFREQLRKELGMAAFAVKMEPKIQASLEENEIVILDGLYSWEEYLYLADKFPFFLLLCIYAQPTIRYDRLQLRQVRPLSKQEARIRDIAEIEKLNKGGPIAIADFLIINEDTKEDLYQRLEKFLESVT